MRVNLQNKKKLKKKVKLPPDRPIKVGMRTSRKEMRRYKLHLNRTRGMHGIRNLNRETNIQTKPKEMAEDKKRENALYWPDILKEGAFSIFRIILILFL